MRAIGTSTDAIVGDQTLRHVHDVAISDIIVVAVAWQAISVDIELARW